MAISKYRVTGINNGVPYSLDFATLATARAQATKRTHRYHDTEVKVTPVEYDLESDREFRRLQQAEKSCGA